MADVLPLPQAFCVQYLGCRVAAQLWGIRYTRGPVDAAVAATIGTSRLPPLRLTVSSAGVSLAGGGPGTGRGPDPGFIPGRFPIDRISYGVQDVVHRHVFAMIVVSDRAARGPFLCHVFACERREEARRLTCALAAAFGAYSARGSVSETPRFAVDLRSPEQIEDELRGRPAELESEA